MKYICETCGAIYDEEVGDVRRGIPAGTPFADLPWHYDCSGCGCMKEAFTKLDPSTPDRQKAPTEKHDSQYMKYASDRQESER